MVLEDAGYVVSTSWWDVGENRCLRLQHALVLVDPNRLPRAPPQVEGADILNTGSYGLVLGSDALLWVVVLSSIDHQLVIAPIIPKNNRVVNSILRHSDIQLLVVGELVEHMLIWIVRLDAGKDVLATSSVEEDGV